MSIKGALSGLRQFLAIESILKMMKKAFYFTLKTLFVFKIFIFVLTFWSCRKTTCLVSLPHFLHNLWRKIFFLIWSINWQSFIVWLLFLPEILGNMCIAIVCKPGCEVMNLEMNLFQIKAFFLHDQKVMIKT